MKELTNQQLIKLMKERNVQLEILKKENTLLLKQVEELNEKLMESEAFKSHFISNVTNEIINPFSSVLGLSQNIMNLKGDDLSTAPALATLIYDESAFLDFQLGNIFAAARMEAGEMVTEVRPLAVGKLLEEVIEKLRHEIDKKHLVLNVGHPSGEALKKSSYFKTDHDKLQLILLNLLSNAVKFSSENGRIRLSYNIEEGQLVLMVSDEGLGMNQDELKRIFDRFQRLDKTINSLNPGNGLGLAVVEGLLYILDGKTEIESAQGKGTLVKVIIPEMSESMPSTDGDGLFNENDEELF